MPVERIQIVDNDELYRRISPKWREHYKQTGRISSAAFLPPKFETTISVDVARLITIEKCLENYLDNGLSILPAESVRIAGLDVNHTPNRCNYAHADISGNFTRGTRKKLANIAK